MIRPKNEKEIEAMRQAGALANHVLLETAKSIQPGVTTEEIDHIAAIEGLGAKSAFIGYKGVSLLHVFL